MHIKEILKEASSIVAGELTGDYRLFLFGSRAMDLQNNRSDIDIGILAGTRLTGKQLLSIQEKLDQIPTLLKIDFVDFNSVTDDFKLTAMKFTRDIRHGIG